ncbi:MAG: hypothetical protein ACRDLK_04340 [Gaiellaceae bacterium]
MLDARACAEACEALLEAVRGELDTETSERLVAALAGPAAVSRVLIDLVDRPSLLLACASVCRDTARAAVGELDVLELPVDASEARGALLAAAESCDRLLDAAG